MNRKDEDKLISIIVPVYNVEQYLSECIESIIEQTYKRFELILIDDGSTDNSSIICDLYKKKDKRINVIHKKNGGLSDARNFGINIAQGEYITFVDSDDKIDEHYLEIMYGICEKYEADIVQCENSRKIEDVGKKSKYFETILLNKEEILHDFFRFCRPNVLACGKLYKKELFNNVRFPIGIIDEDNFTTYKLLEKSKMFIALNNILYFYRINPFSITQKKFTKERLNIYGCVDDIRKYLSKQLYEYGDDINYYQMRLGIQLYNQIIKANVEQEYYNKLEEIREFLVLLWNNRFQVELKYRIIMLMIVHRVSLYNVLVKWFKK